MRGNPWTNDDDAILREKWEESHNIRSVAKAVGRSLSAVRSRMDRIGIERPKVIPPPKPNYDAYEPVYIKTELQEIDERFQALLRRYHAELEIKSKVAA